MKDSANKPLVIMFALTLIVFVIFLANNYSEEANKFNFEELGQNESFTEEETIILEIGDKTPLRATNTTGNVIYSYLIKFKSDDPLYNGKTIAVSKKDYSKYEIGNSYPFTLKKHTEINVTLTP